jgi:hypothetical protein
MMIEESATAATDSRLDASAHRLLSALITEMYDSREDDGGHCYATRGGLAAVSGLKLPQVRQAVKILKEAGYVTEDGRGHIVIVGQAVWREENEQSTVFAPLLDEVALVLTDTEFDRRYWRLTHWPSPTVDDAWCVAEQYKGKWRIVVDSLSQQQADLIASAVHSMTKCEGYCPAWAPLEDSDEVIEVVIP